MAVIQLRRPDGDVGGESTSVMSWPWERKLKITGLSRRMFLWDVPKSVFAWPTKPGLGHEIGWELTRRETMQVLK
jgi:hypothetical protein